MGFLTGLLGLFGGASKFFEGKEMQEKGDRARENFRFSELTNPYKDLSVSTLGSDLQRQQMNQTTANSLDTLQSAGARGVIGGLGGVVAQNQMNSQRIAADLDQQQKQLDMAAAQQDVRNQEIIRRGEEQELAGYGNLMNVGMGMKYGGISNMANSFGYFDQTKLGQNISNFTNDLFKPNQPPTQATPIGTRPQATSAVAGLQPQGLTTMTGFNNQIIY